MALKVTDERGKEDPIEPTVYMLDIDKINSIDDIKAVLWSLGLTWRPSKEEDLGDLLKYVKPIK